jgi:hypothetical protein
VDLRSAEILMPAVPRLFLGRFDEETLRRELEDAGILRGLAERGHAEVAIETEYQGGEHRLRVDSASGGPSLVDLRLGEGTTLADEPLLRQRGPDVLSFLSIHWMSLQDPGREFTAERPRLPGQDHPGLRLARPLIERVLLWATQWGKDALLNLPEYYHNAVFYSKAFKFVAPVRQGRFEALRRDLALLHVAQASSAVEQRRVLEEPWGAPLHWEAGEMLFPISEPVRRYLESPEYVTAVARARDGARFRLR